MQSRSRSFLSYLGALLVGAALVYAFVPPSQPADAAVRRIEVFTETHDYGNLVDAAGESNTVSVLGAALGDACEAALSVSTQGMTQTCAVTATDTAIVRMQNETGGALDLASATQSVYLFRND